MTTENSVEIPEGFTPLVPPVVRQAEIIIPEGKVQLPANQRCDHCGVQAWVEVEMAFTRTVQHINAISWQDVNESMIDKILLCAHDYAKHEKVLKETALRIVDYRDTLVAQEKAGGPAL